MLVTISSCQKEQQDLEPENYDNFFPVKPPEKPVISYDEMNPLPCDPTESEDDFTYPGVVIKENKREYTVTLGILFTEKHKYFNYSQIFSKLTVRYIDAQGNLQVLRSYKHKGKEATIKNKKIIKKTIKVSSGYPLYIGVYGAGFNYFNTSIFIKAVSKDGLIISPKLTYKQQTAADGYQELPPYCQKIILP